jgi:hypothetical protein
MQPARETAMPDEWINCPRCRGKGKIRATTKKANWLEAFGDIWIQAYGGRPNYGTLGRYLKPLVEQFEVTQVLYAWEKYINGTDGRYASVSRFAETIGTWLRQPDPRPARKRPHEADNTKPGETGLAKNLPRFDSRKLYD